MFAQLLITLAFTGLVAEVLCRIFLQGSVVTLTRELVTQGSGAPESARTPRAESEHARLRRQLGARRRELAELRARLEESQRTAAVQDQLAATEAELAELEAALAELEGGRQAPPGT